jgi:hypothetical protein
MAPCSTAFLLMANLNPGISSACQGANLSAIFLVRFYTVRDLSGNRYEVGNMIYPVYLHMLNQKCRTLQKNLHKMQCKDSTIYCIVLLRDLPTGSSVISM